jgi:hypothetical protein
MRQWLLLAGGGVCKVARGVSHARHARLFAVSRIVANRCGAALAERPLVLCAAFRRSGRPSCGISQSLAAPAQKLLANAASATSRAEAM